MRNIFYSLLLLYITFQTNAQGLLWAKAFSGPNSNDVANDMVVDQVGNVYTTGYFADTVDFDPGPGVNNLIANKADIFISKLDPLGNFIWAKRIGGNSIFDSGKSITLDSFGNIYLTGYFSDTTDFDPGPGVFYLNTISEIPFVLKLNNSGDFIWAKCFDGIYGYGVSISVDPVGRVNTVGNFSNTMDFNPGIGIFNLSSNGQEDSFICKLDSNGTFMWAASFGGSWNDYCTGLAIDLNGNEYISGVFDGNVDFDPGPNSFLLNSATQNIYICKLTNAGNFVWAKTFNAISPGHAVCNSIQTQNNNSIYLAGYYNGSIDFDPGPGSFLQASSSDEAYVAKLDSGGSFIWVKTFKSSSFSIATSLILDPSNNIYFTGRFKDTCDFEPGINIYNIISNSSSDDIFISKLDPNGSLIFAKSIGGTQTEEALSIGIDNNGNVYASGYFFGSCDFDPNNNQFVITSTGYEDIFILKLSKTVGVEEIKKDVISITIFPNPTTGQINYILPDFLTNVKLILTNSLGVKVYEHDSDTTFNTINKTALQSGYYTFAFLQNGRRFCSGKLIIL